MSYNFSVNTLKDVKGRDGGGILAIGRVKSIVLGEFLYDNVKDTNYTSPRDIGKISYDLLYQTKNFPNDKGSSPPAYPLFSSFKQFPLISEIVLIVLGPDSNMNDNILEQGLYYFPPYALWNSQNHNAFPNMRDYEAYVRSVVNSQNVENKALTGDNPGELPLGYMFKELLDIRSLRPFEGDTIIESRFGSSIRFGSTNTTKKLNSWSSAGELRKPITIIRNGQGLQPTRDYFQQTVEDINKDGSTIWMMAGQTVKIDNLELYPLRSYGFGVEAREQLTQAVDRVDKSTELRSGADQDRQNIKA
jgi:hypothetical protein